MNTLQIENISAQTGEMNAVLRALNTAHAEATSHLSETEWQDLLGLAFHASCVPDAAFLIALDQDAAYENANFAWFRERYPRFVYIDRVVVSADHQGKGLARALYNDLFRAARAACQDRIVCEVNLDPPNPESDAFHEKMGFAELGTATLTHNGKTVRYLGVLTD